MAQPGVSDPEPPAGTTNFLKRLFGRGTSSSGLPADASSKAQTTSNHDNLPEKPGLIRRVSRKVVPGLPRVQTFKRQQSEKRVNLDPVQPTPAERRAVSVDRRAIISRTTSHTGASPRAVNQTLPRASAPELYDRADVYGQAPFVSSLPASPNEEPEYPPLDRISTQDGHVNGDIPDNPPYGEGDAASDSRSITSTQIQDELEKVWILNLSMQFRDRSKREKFFITYRENDTIWRRVTVSVDYRGCAPGSLEHDLLHTSYQRDKSAKIYEAIRESLQEIQFYHTVTNLKLQTTDNRLHVHVVEDVNEIIDYPEVRQVRHLECPLVRERDIEFHSHMSGFVYKVLVDGEILIKKEIPGPDTVDEFLYEVNALNSLRFSKHVIRFYGLVVDDEDQHVKGLLISYAEKGALIDVIFDHRQETALNNQLDTPGLSWKTRVKWARQVVEGLADLHESGFVQGDFTLSNIVIDGRGDAKIIDINRRGCPVGWEPPEATPLLKSGQRISMYIGVKSDLFQLGMVLWALATEDDEPEAHARPLVLCEKDQSIPDWYRQLVRICLSENPRMRLQASSLLSLFPADSDDIQNYLDPYGIYTQNGDPAIRTVSPPHRYAYGSIPATYDSGFGGCDPPFNDSWRGRSPPRSFSGDLGAWDAQKSFNRRSWSYGGNLASYSDVGEDEVGDEDHSKSATPTTNTESAMAVDVPANYHYDKGMDDSGQDLAVDKAHEIEVDDITLKSEAIVEPADNAEVLPAVVDITTGEETVAAEDSREPESLSLGPKEFDSVPVTGVGTCSDEDRENIASLGNTEPDVQIDSGTGNKGSKLETDPRDVVAEDAEPVVLAEVSDDRVETVIAESQPASSGEGTPTGSKVYLSLSGESQINSALPESPQVAVKPDGVLAGVGGAYDADAPNLTKMPDSLEDELLELENTTREATAGTADPEK